MDENQKSRLIVIGVAGVLLLAGGGWWVVTQHQNAEKADQAAIPQENANPALNTATNTAAPSPQTGSNPLAQPGNPAQTAVSPTAQGTPVSPPAQTAVNPPAQTAVNPPAQSTPVNPPARTAANPPAQSTPPAQTAVNPPVQSAPVNPPVQQKPVNPPVQAAVKPPVQQTPINPPAQTAMNQPAQTAMNPFQAAPNMLAFNPLGARPAPNALAPTPTPANRYPATRREEAIIAAKQVAGREDPMFGTFEKTPYPAPWTKIGAAPETRTTAMDDKEDKDKDKDKKDDKTAVVPPPPPPSKLEKPLPPPPPSNLGPGGGEGIAIDQLPPPPDKPLVTPQLKLTAILGNKAVLSVPLVLRNQNKWPSVICLGPGEKFEDPDHGTFSVVQVDRDSVTIEEDQERSVKSLPQIK